VHLSFFSKQTLTRFLEHNGFKVLSTRTWGVPLRLVLPPYFPKFLRRTKSYYRSDTELSIEDWHDEVIQSKTSGIFRKLHLYEGIKNLCNFLLNSIDGGTVVDVIVKKQEE
jgi:hypothetical protein